MSKQIEMEEKEIKPEYLKKLEKIRKGKYHKFNTVAELTYPLRKTAKKAGMKESDVVDFIHRMRAKKSQKNENC